MKQVSSTPLRLERLRRGWSRSYVAEQIGVEVATVGRWERRESCPHPEHRQKLCTLFGKNAKELGLFTEASEESGKQEFVSANNEPLQKPITSQPNSISAYPVSNLALPYPVQQMLPVSTKSDRDSKGSPLLSWWRAKQRRHIDNAENSTGHFHLSRRSFLVGMGAFGLIVFGAGTWKTAVKDAASKPGTQKKGLERIWQLLNQYTNNWINNLASSPDSSKIIAATGKNGVIVLDMQKQTVAHHYRTANQWVNDVDWSKNNLLAAANGDFAGGSVQVWHSSESEPVFTLHRNYSMRTVAWSPNGDYLACAGHSPAVEVWNPITARPVKHYVYADQNSTGINRVKWSSDARYLASADDTSTVHVWEVATGKQVTIYHGHQERVIDITWCPGKYLIASASADQTAQVWDALSGRTIVTYTGHENVVHSIDWSPNTQYLVSGSADTTAQVWQALTGQHVDTYASRSSGVLAVCWSNNGSFIAIGSEEQGIEVWQAPTNM